LPKKVKFELQFISQEKHDILLQWNCAIIPVGFSHGTVRDIPLAFGIFKIQTIGAYYYVFFLPFILAYSRISSNFVVVLI
jgi:hypothetical protein